jgi:hypothetical protein
MLLSRRNLSQTSPIKIAHKVSHLCTIIRTLFRVDLLYRCNGLCHLVLEHVVSGSMIKDNLNTGICFGNRPIIMLKVVDCHFLGSFAMEGSYMCMLYCGGILLFWMKRVVALRIMVWLQQDPCQDSFCLRHQ